MPSYGKVISRKFIKSIVLASLLTVGLSGAPTTVWGLEDVRIRGGVHADYTRLVFDWPQGVDYQARIEEGALVVEFARPGSFDPGPAQRVLGPALAKPRVSEDGLQVVIPLVGTFDLKHFRLDKRIVVDLWPASPEQADAAVTPGDSNADEGQKPEKSGRDAALDAPESDASLTDAAKLLEEAAQEAPQEAVKARETDKSPGESAEATAGLVTENRPISLLPESHPKPQAEQKTEIAPEAAKTVEAQQEIAPGAQPRNAPTQVLPQASRMTPAGGSVEILTAEEMAEEELGAEVILGAVPESLDPLQLRFAWPDPTTAAAFRKGEEIWLVFDRDLDPGSAALVAEGAPMVRAARQISSENGGALVLSIEPRVAPLLRREEHGWLVDLRPRVLLPDDAFDVELVEAEGRAKVVRFATEEAGRIHWLNDPQSGERLVVVPVGELGKGLGKTQGFTQFEALASQQGLVLRPLGDGLELAVTDNGILVRHKEGLLVSSNETRGLLPLDGDALRDGRRLFNLSKWRHGGQDNFLENKHILLQRAVRAEGQDLVTAHLDLARFYFAWGLASETLGLLNVLESEAPRLAQDPEVRLMRAASAFLLEDFDTAGRLLSDPVMAGEREALLWQSAYSALSQDWQVAANGFAKSDELIATYPNRVRNNLLLWGTEARLGVGDTGGASQYLIALAKRDLGRPEEAHAKYLSGRRFYINGDVELARQLWGELVTNNHQASQARARLGLLEMDIDQGKIARADAIRKLERLRFAWRGDDFERSLMLRLASLYEAEGDRRKALNTLREAVVYFPDEQKAKAVTERMRRLFLALFMDSDKQPIPPLEALALYEEYKELSPGGSVGEQITRRLSDRLVEIDLLDQAAALLEDQIDHRLTGAPKAAFGARLALVRLLDRKPDLALAALDRSGEPDLPAELLSERGLLRARAHDRLGQAKEALAALGSSENPAAMELRADILWRLKDWNAASLAMQRLIPATPDEANFSGPEAQRIMNYAIALTMAEDPVRLIELYRNYAPLMAKTEHSSAFRLLAGNLGSGSSGSVAERLDSVDDVQEFYRDYQNPG